MAETTPYTYLIGWKEHKKYYYGVRYAKKCDPNEIWKKYFTSSNYVHRFTALHGKPDIIEIRKTFQTPADAIKWETKVLKRMKVLYRDDFLNANIAGSFVFTEEILNKIRSTKKKNINVGMSGKMWITNGLDSTVIAKTEKIPEGWRKGRKVSETFSHVSTIWITDGKCNKRIAIDDSIPNGWYRGHSVSDKNSLKASSKGMWITDGVSNRKIKKSSQIPFGWKRGRSNTFSGRWGNK